jgi:hypothetical protein
MVTMTRLGPFIHIVRFILLVLIQGLIVNEIDLGRQVHPMIHLLFIMLLPIDLSAWLVMIIAFFYGLCIDTFTSTIGMHISACVLLAAVRPLVLRLLSPREGYEFGSTPNVQMLGVRWFVAYVSLLTFLHHLWYFFIEKFGFSDFFDTLSRAFLSTLASIVLIMLAQFLFGPRLKRS